LLLLVLDEPILLLPDEADVDEVLLPVELEVPFLLPDEALVPVELEEPLLLPDEADVLFGLPVLELFESPELDALTFDT